LKSNRVVPVDEALQVVPKKGVASGLAKPAWVRRVQEEVGEKEKEIVKTAARPTLHSRLHGRPHPQRAPHSAAPCSAPQLPAKAACTPRRGLPSRAAQYIKKETPCVAPGVELRQCRYRKRRRKRNRQVGQALGIQRLEPDTRLDAWAIVAQPYRRQRVTIPA